MVVVIVVAVAAAATVPVLITGLIPRVKPAAAGVAGVMAAVDVTPETRAEGVLVVVAVPRGLSMEAKTPAGAAVELGATVLAAEAAAVPSRNPLPGAAAEGIGDAKRDGPVGATCDVAGGAGVDEGLMPKAKPPLGAAVAGAAVVGAGWVRLEGVPVPKEKPPPPDPVAGVGTAAVDTCTLLVPKLNPPNDSPPGAVVAAGAAGAAGWGWV